MKIYYSKICEDKIIFAYFTKPTKFRQEDQFCAILVEYIESQSISRKGKDIFALFNGTEKIGDRRSLAT